MVSDAPQPSPGDRDLHVVLHAWNEATSRLQKTHEALQEEVHQLRVELAAKNCELQRRNRLADLGRMASYMAHEVRNNLVPVKLYLSLLLRAAPSDCGGVANKLETSLAELESGVHDLLDFASHREPKPTLTPLRRLVADVCDSFQPQFAAQGVALELDVAPLLRPVLDEHLLRRALVNLIRNALEAQPHGGRVVVTAVDGPGALEIEVADDGPGLSDDAAQRLFQPFATTKQHGVGLGLAVVDRVASAHGGEVSATNCPEGGAAFTLRFPRRALEAAA